MVVSVVVLEFDSYLHLLESIVYRGILIVSKNIFSLLQKAFYASSMTNFQMVVVLEKKNVHNYVF